jgi:orotate phosphoribosyltransferase
MSWLAVELYRRGMVKIGEFTLSSGIKSPFYIDLRRLYSYPELARRVVSELASRIPMDRVDVIAGIETAGIPLATYLACITNKPLVYVRKERKQHGSGSIVEGSVHGMRVVVVDDVVTTGNSFLKAINNLREEGGLPVLAAAIVDRGQGARRLLMDHGVELVSLTTAIELFRELYLGGYIDADTYASIVNYIRSFNKV